MKSGVSDLCLPFPSLDYSSLWLELKTSKGRVSPNQKEFLSFVISGGAYGTIARTGAEGIDIIEGYVRNCRPINKIILDPTIR